jgi:hypothetical protein
MTDERTDQEERTEAEADQDRRLALSDPIRRAAGRNVIHEPGTEPRPPMGQSTDFGGGPRGAPVPGNEPNPIVQEMREAVSRQRGR